MESGSEDENIQRKVSNKKANSSNEGNAKPKRQMKTPFQLETLEDAFALETYPSEATRAELSEKLGLTDRQLQTWFCHRRLKEKKETPSKIPKKGATLPPDSPIDDFRVGLESDDGTESDSGSGSGSSPCLNFRKLGGSSSPGMMGLRAIACVEAQLGQPLRDDGPMLGMEFDPLPPDAFEANPELHKRSGQPYESKLYDRCASKAAARAIHEYQFLPDHSSLKSDPGRQVTHSHFYGSPVDGARGEVALFVHGEEPLFGVHGIQGQGSQVPLLPQQYSTGILSLSSKLSDDPRNSRKRKSDENRIAREVEAQDNGIRKELEKLDNKRRKSEERMRKEVERHERERRKEEERLIREKQRGEERLQREKQREEERRQKILQKEYFRAEKKRQKEELQREKEEERLRVAREKATARKIAKESTGLLEDEQLELMECAAASKGIPSIIHLDHNDLENLESFRGSLSLFPPKSVQLKRPFAIHPWTDSEENVGNLLMAWKFFITFSDVLKLWPFTLDEFVQAFHDYESRLLGEIHVALLKSIIKDIEDVARTTVTGLGANQYSASHLEGGHPQIVEGAYSWGFDIRSWQHHLNPLTWPEIFRQLAISAGYGPQLKKQSVTWTYMGDNDQDLQSKGCEDVVSTLRNGAAAENAFALMRKKGLLLRRKSRHRLTPGTVKYAAFHVLSLEGSKGLTVFELAEKIQKSGLRDVTTSKRPEACISVAMTRDAKLFERIAPSTYCVRSAYRKDPADAEAILEAARQKIQQFENGLLGGEDADEVEKEEVGRDEDSEGDVDEDPEVDIATPSNANKDTDYHKDEVNLCLVSEKVHASTDGAVNVPGKLDKDLLSFPSNTMKDDDAPCNTGHYVIGEENGTVNPDQHNIEIDESKFGESWIQGLSEAEYSHLSVEERLNALVALIGIANEGNSIRTAIEDRLEAANALKKQMWIEAQLDKSFVKEETIIKMDLPSVIGMKAEAHLPNYPMEGSQSQFPPAANKNDELSPSNPEDRKPLLCSQNFLNGLNSYPVELRPLGPDDFSGQQPGYALKRSRLQLKSYISHRAEEIYAYRSLPLGLDRRCNRYWQFVASASKSDPCAGRIFVELHGGVWRMIDSEEAFDALLSSLDARGIRESHLRIMLQKIETSFKENVRRNLQCVAAINRSGSYNENEASEIDYAPDFPAGFDRASGAICGLSSEASETLSSFKVQLGTKENEIKSALSRYQDFQMWMWKECYNCSTLCAMKYGKKRSAQLLVVCDVCLGSHVPEEMHCFHCHQTFGSSNKGFNFSEHKCNENKKLDTKDTCTLDSSIPSGISLLKSLCALVEVSVPLEALESIWTEGHRKIWGTELNASSSVDEILKILTHLENAIKQDHLSPTFETTREFLGSNPQSGSDFTDSVLPWIPQTTAAVSLRLLVLDASIMYLKQEKAEPAENRGARTYIKLPSRTSLFIKNKGLESEKLEQVEPMRTENFSDLSNSKRNKYKQGKGGPESGRKSQRRASNSKHRASKQSTKEKNNLSLHLKQHDQRILGQNSGRHCRTVRKSTERGAADDTMVASKTDVVKPKANGVTLRDLDEEWRGEKIRMMQGVNPPDSNSMEEESDDNAQAEGYEQGSWEPDFNGDCNDWNGESMEASDEDGNGIKLQKEKDYLDEKGEDEEEEDLEMSDASDEAANETRSDDG